MSARCIFQAPKNKRSRRWISMRDYLTHLTITFHIWCTLCTWRVIRPHKTKIPIIANRKGDAIKRVIAAITVAVTMKRIFILSRRLPRFSYLRLSRYPLCAASCGSFLLSAPGRFRQYRFSRYRLLVTSYSGLCTTRKVQGEGRGERGREGGRGEGEGGKGSPAR